MREPKKEISGDVDGEEDSIARIQTNETNISNIGRGRTKRQKLDIATTPTGEITGAMDYVMDDVKSNVRKNIDVEGNAGFMDTTGRKVGRPKKYIKSIKCEPKDEDEMEEKLAKIEDNDYLSDKLRSCIFFWVNDA